MELRILSNKMRLIGFSFLPIYLYKTAWGILKKYKMEKASQKNFEEINFKENPSKTKEYYRQHGLKEIRTYPKNCRGKKYQQGGRTTFYLPACFEFTAFKSGTGAGHKALCPKRK